MTTAPPSPGQATEFIGGPEKRDVVLCAYDERWPAFFEAHARRIEQALGDAALRVEHFGSTSVPGLSAKPISDILLVVADSADEAAYLPALLTAGYELRVREPDFDEHRMVRTPARDVHVHVFSPTSKEIDRYLVFRERLRHNAADRQRYEATKRALATQDWATLDDYAQAKSEVVESIIAAGWRGEDSEAPQGDRI